MILIPARKWASGEVNWQLVFSGRGTSVSPASWVELPFLSANLQDAPGISASPTCPLDTSPPGAVGKAPSGELGISVSLSPFRPWGRWCSRLCERGHLCPTRPSPWAEWTCILTELSSGPSGVCPPFASVARVLTASGTVPCRCWVCSKCVGFVLFSFLFFFPAGDF